MDKKTFTISIASFIEINLAGKLNTFALLCFLISSAISLLQHKPALTPSYLLATILTPFPVPHIMIPLLSLFFDISFARGCIISG